MKPCKSTYTAAERLAPHVDGVSIERVKGGFDISTDGVGTTRKKNGVKTLAYLASVVRLSFGTDLDEVRDAVRWIGRIPSRGLAGWQEAALMWLRGEIG